MKKLVTFLVVVILLSGCNSELTLSKVTPKGNNKTLQSFTTNAQDQNGVYLYLDNPKTIYIYLNESNVIQGEKATYVTDFKVEKDGNTLKILYNTDKTSNYSKPKLNHELLYKIKLDKKYDTIRSFQNGEEVSFNAVSGK
ncbi:hypothetical protein [Neobacillus mesonae]|uniref:Lipoprotein n=1 Tax=Neobacillus mesonae TaxID=1193713 RepID=A0A3T0HYQ2_9BACI|nr:hypothetical protein [Neobacillus mesonae]AZU62147.1 hypothetical protein CHR53_13125 [Neobacillus mesonae]